METKETFKRYLVFTFAIIFTGLGVAFISSSELGTTPITSINYELSLHTPYSLGTITFIFNLIIMLLQFALLRKNERTRRNILLILWQIPVSFIFAAAIDIGMMIINTIIPQSYHFYVVELFMVAIGCFSLAFGVSLQVSASVAMVSCEALVKQLSKLLKKEFGIVKLCFDISLVTIAVVLALIITNFTKIECLREGTVVGALAVGPIVRIILPRLKFLERFYNNKAENVEAIDTIGFKRVITISREYGCGGRIIGKMIAKKLGIEFYDTNLIELISKESGFSKEYVENNDSMLENSLLYEMIMQDYSVNIERSMSSKDALFVASSKVIRKIAKDHDCVIVGRAADQILKDNKQCLNFYLYSNTDKKLDFCQKEYNLSKEVAIANMQKFDKQRAEYYLHYTGKHINDARNYDATFNVGLLGLNEVSELICKLYHEHLA